MNPLWLLLIVPAALVLGGIVTLGAFLLSLLKDWGRSW